MRRRGVFCLAIAVLGADLRASNAVEPPQSLAIQLAREIGGNGSVAILGSYEGLIALSTDGKKRRTLVPGGGVFGVRVDPRGEVIWYRAERTGTTSDLMVLDLRETQAHPKLVIPNLALTEEPEIAYEKPDELFPHGGTRSILLLSAAGPVLQREVDSCAGKRRKGCPKLVRATYDAAPNGKRGLVIEPSAVSFLQELANRGRGRSLFLPSPTGPKPAAVPMGQFACKHCGRASVIPGTPYLAVLVQAMGDFCHIVAQVYDQKVREYLDIESAKRSPTPFDDLGGEIGDTWISASGDAFIQSGVLFNFKTGRIGWKGPAEGGGFLGGGYWLPAAPDYPCGN